MIYTVVKSAISGLYNIKAPDGSLVFKDGQTDKAFCDEECRQLNVERAQRLSNVRDTKWLDEITTLRTRRYA